MTNKDLISQYVDTGMGIPRYQYDKLSSNDKKTYLRKIEMGIESKIKQFEEHDDEDDDYNLKDIYNSLDLDFLDYHYGILPERIQTDLIYYNPLIIKNIKNPTEKIQLIALREDIDLINDIVNNGTMPSEHVQLVTVTQKGYKIRYFDNPSEEVQLAAVKQNGEAIRHILAKGIEPSQEVLLATVKEDGFMLFNIIKAGITLSQEILIAAVSENSSSINYIENPSEQVQLAAVNKSGKSISNIKNPTPKVQLVAVNNDIHALRNIKNPTDEAIALHNKLYVR